MDYNKLIENDLGLEHIQKKLTEVELTEVMKVLYKKDIAVKNILARYKIKSITIQEIKYINDITQRESVRLERLRKLKKATVDAENLDEVMSRCRELINSLEKLDIIYLRVSTKNTGQDETDQIHDIVKSFDLDLDKCIVISARESAYQQWKQKTRKLNIIKTIFEEFMPYDKILYVWSLDRIYRDQDNIVEFFQYLGKRNGMIISHQQKFLHQLKNTAGGMGKALYNFMIEVYGWVGETESKDKGEKLLKSLHKKKDRLYTNKGNLYGGKLKTVSGKIISDVKVLEKIENFVCKHVKKKTPYLEIRDKLLEKNVKVSNGYITKLKNRKNIKV